MPSRPTTNWIFRGPTVSAACFNSSKLELDDETDSILQPSPPPFCVVFRHPSTPDVEIGAHPTVVVGSNPTTAMPLGRQALAWRHLRRYPTATPEGTNRKVPSLRSARKANARDGFFRTDSSSCEWETDVCDDRHHNKLRGRSRRLRDSIEFSFH